MSVARPASSKVSVAFMSYAHYDDREGRLSKFRDRLAGELQSQTGVEMDIFKDSDAITVGQPWRKRLDEGLATSTLLLPIVTPSFLRSPHCREELETFAAHEQALGRDDLILPIYYIDCESFLASPADEPAAAALAHDPRASVLRLARPALACARPPARRAGPDEAHRADPRGDVTRGDGPAGPTGASCAGHSAGPGGGGAAAPAGGGASAPVAATGRRRGRHAGRCAARLLRADRRRRSPCRVGVLRGARHRRHVPPHPAARRPGLRRGGCDRVGGIADGGHLPGARHPRAQRGGRPRDPARGARSRACLRPARHGLPGARRVPDVRLPRARARTARRRSSWPKAGSRSTGSSGSPRPASGAA